jgi:hypothetical protein
MFNELTVSIVDTFTGSAAFPLLYLNALTARQLYQLYLGVI